MQSRSCWSLGYNEAVRLSDAPPSGRHFCHVISADVHRFLFRCVVGVAIVEVRGQYVAIDLYSLYSRSRSMEYIVYVRSSLYSICAYLRSSIPVIVVYLS